MDASKLERIRNVLAKAEDAAATEHERESYTALAVQLMAKYGIEEAMLAAAPDRQRLSVGNRRITCSAPYAMEKVVLLNGLCNAMGLRLVRLQGRGADECVHVFGFESDMDRAELLYTSLLLQQGPAMRQAEITRQEWYDSGIKAWRRSFLAGYAQAVARRVEAAEAEARATFERERTDAGASTALVVADRSKAVTEAFRAEYPRTRNSSRQLTGNGHGAGRDAGNRANLGGRAVGGSRSSIGA